MDEVKTGIFVKGNGATPSLNIESNAIYCDNVGIDMLNIGHYQKTTVTGNRVYVDYQLGSPISAQKGIGIKVSGSDGQSPLNGSIESNAIHIYERNYGMSLSSLYSGLIRENVIYEYTPDAIAGIQFQGSSLAAIACNYIHGYSSDYFQGKNIGIDVNNSLGNLYLCNQVDHTGIGLRFSGVCSALTSPMIAQTDVRGNSMDEHGYGFMMQSDAIFGSLTKPNIQAHRGNNWSNDYGEDRAIHYGSPDQIALSKFRVHTNGTPYYYYPHSDDTNNPNAPMPPTPYALGHIWFEVIDDGNPYVCGETCLPDHLIETDPDSISTFGLAIAQDSLSFTSEFDAAMKERLRRQLYRLLNEHQALMNQDSSLLQFYSDASSSVISDMTIIDQLKTAAIAVDSTSKAQLLLWDAEIIERFDSISAAESELPSEPDSSEIAEFEAMQIAYLVEIDSFLLLQRELACGIWTSQVAFIDSAFVLNSDTEPSTDMEANEIFVNQLHLGKAFFGNFDLTTNEKNRLDSIANQCPTLGGDAVFGARSILSAAGWWEYYDDDSLCQVSALRPTVQTTLHTSKSDLLIYPNPTSERISVQIAKGWTGKADINITDALGNSVMHKSFDLMPTVSGSIEIIVAGLPPGLFVIHVYIDDKIAGSKKFIKIK